MNHHNNYSISVTKAQSSTDVALLVRLESCRVTSGSHQFSVPRALGQGFCPK